MPPGSRCELEADGFLSVTDNGRGIPVDPHPKFKNKSRARSHHDDAALGRQVRQQGLQHLRRPARRRRLGGQRAVGDAARSRWRAASSSIAWCSPRRAAGQAREARRRSRTGAAPRCASSRTRRSSARAPPSSRPACCAWRARRPTCSAASRSAGSVRPALIKRRDAGRGRVPFPRRPEGIPEAHASRARRASPRTSSPAASSKEGGHGSVEWAVRLGRRRGRLPQLLLQHHPDGRGRHARERPALGALQGPARPSASASATSGRGQITADDVMGTAAAMLSVFIREPEFQGQTKDKLATPGGHPHRRERGARRLRPLAGRQPQQATKLLEWTVDQAEERLKRRREKEVGRQSATRKLRLPGKLADCSHPAGGRHRDLHRRGRFGRRLGQAGARPRDAGRSCRCAARSSTSPTPRRRSCRRTSCSPT